MRQYLRQILGLTANSFGVLLGDPFTLILHLCLVLGAGIFACLPSFAFSEHLRLLRDQSLALAFMGGALAATIGAAKVVGEEGRKGMTPLIMSRPVSAGTFLLGKWLGLAAMLFLLLTAGAIAYLWASRIAYHNHHIEKLGAITLALAVALALGGAGLHHALRRGCFAWQANLALGGILAAGFLVVNFWGYDGEPQTRYGELPDWPTAIAYLYLYLALLTYAALLVAVAVSADLSVLMAISAVVFFVGLLSEYLLATFLSAPGLGGVCRVVLPNWQLFWIAERLADHGPPPPIRLFASAFHALGQAAIFLLAGQWWLHRRELSESI